MKIFDLFLCCGISLALLLAGETWSYPAHSYRHKKVYRSLQVRKHRRHLTKKIISSKGRRKHLKIKKKTFHRRYVVKSNRIRFYNNSTLATELNAALREGNGSASMGVFVKSMANHDVLYTHQSNSLFVPASTLKILTAETALLYLGPNYRFSTRLLTDAKIVRGGILQGNLYVIFDGDPLLTYDDLFSLFYTLKTQQIKKVSGHLYLDYTAYDQSLHGPGWIKKDKSYCYAAPISASIIDRNCLITKFASPSEPAKGLAAYNRVVFDNLLRALSVTLEGSIVVGHVPTNYWRTHFSLLANHSSFPLRMLVNKMMKNSDNIIAGSLFKKVGQLYAQGTGSWENGKSAMLQILSKKMGINISGIHPVDGSGLSTYNLMTPLQMMQVLDFAYHHERTANDFISSLPIAGVDGTLKHRMRHIARKVRAKTGTMTGVFGLAGYTVSADQEPLAFVIMINGQKGMGWRYKAVEDRIVTALTRYSRKIKSS